MLISVYTIFELSGFLKACFVCLWYRRSTSRAYQWFPVFAIILPTWEQRETRHLAASTIVSLAATVLIWRRLLAFTGWANTRKVLQGWAD